MKPTSILAVIVVIAIFAAIEWPIVSRQYFEPRLLTSSTATLQGEVIMVGTPVGGTIRSSPMHVGDHVAVGTELFTILPQSPTDPGGGNLLSIVAVRDGVVTDIMTTPGAYVRPNDFLASISDLSPDALSIDAELHVSPDDVGNVRLKMPATVFAPSIDDGTPLPAEVVSINPIYNFEKQSLHVKLRLTQLPQDAGSLRSGLPLTVSVEMENKNVIKSFFEALAARTIATSQANQ